MRVLVTGAGGFIGSHLVEHLAERGPVRALVHYRADGSAGHMDAYACGQGSPDLHGIEVVAGDVREHELVRSQADGCDVIYNLAAIVSIPHSYVSPEQYLATNVGGAQACLAAARHHKIRMVQLSTSEVYGAAQRVPMDEQHPLSAQSPYAASKIAADQFCAAARRSFGVDARIVRPFNAFGPRQSQRAVIPNVVAQVLRARRAGRQACEVYVGTIDYTRDFTFVSDTVRGIAAVGKHGGSYTGPVNLCSGKEIRIGDLVRIVGDVLGVRTEPVLDDSYVRPQASEVSRLLGNAMRARALLDWRPEVGLREGIQRVAEWIEPRLDNLRAGMVA